MNLKAEYDLDFYLWIQNRIQNILSDEFIPE